MSIVRRQTKVQWYWNTKCDPCSSDNKWFEYTDMENEMIEEAFDGNKEEIEVDGDYMINLKEHIQYSKLDHNKKQAIKRIVLDSSTTAYIQLREERFSSPMSLVSISSTEIMEKAKKNNVRVQMLRHTIHFPASYLWFTTSRNATFADIVDEAVQGILQEGIDRNKKCEAEWLVKKLLTVRHYGEGIDRLDDDGVPDEIGRMCVLLYIKNSFLFREINFVLRDIENITQERLKRWGPFSALLAFYLEQIQTSEVETVYRGINCTDEERLKYMSDHLIHFSAFTSTSTNRALASIFGNTLLIIQPQFYSRFSRKIRSYGVDIQNLSHFPQEEEFLLYPGVLFEFVTYEYNNDTKQHVIYLKAFDSGTI